MKSVFVGLFFAAVFLQLVGCASEDQKPQPKVKKDALFMDSFTVENGMPLRQVQEQVFYFKHCELETRRAFQSKVEYSCNER